MNLSELYIDKPLDQSLVKPINAYQKGMADSMNTRIPNYYLGGDLADALGKYGWKQLNSGAFSLVYENPAEPYILKLNTNPDQAFSWFAFLTHKFPNKHFPKISAMRAIKILGKLYYTYAIEKLEKIPYIDDAAYISSICYSQIVRPSDHYYPERVEQLQLYMSLEQAVSLLQACDIIHDHYEGKRTYGLDLHSGNIMQRHDGTIVITDPFAGTWKN